MWSVDQPGGRRPTAGQPGGDTAPPGDDQQQPITDRRQLGGGGVAWMLSAGAQRLVVLAQPGGLSSGMVVPGHPAAAARLAAEVLQRRNESQEGLRAVGVAAAILSLLAAASSVVWALYKCKPGLVRDEPAVPDLPIYRVDLFLDTYRPPTPPPQPALSPRLSLGVAVMNGGLASPTLLGRVNLASQTALHAANWNNYITDLSSLFTTQLTATGSGVAGLMAGETTVTRGTQTELIGTGLGRQLLHGRLRLIDGTLKLGLHVTLLCFVSCT